MSFPRYPEYKDSGVGWLGKIPVHWAFGTLRRLIVSVANGTTANQIESANDAIAVSRIETISTGVINFQKVGFVDKTVETTRFLLKSGDILLSHINSLPMVGNVALYKGERPLVHGMNLLRLQPVKGRASSEWLIYWLKSKNIRQEFESRAKPAINQASISTGSVRCIPTVIPPINEQSQIARFLDHETAKIDALIREQERLIELLQEKRQAVISHAVTKGLDPEVPMKDSGVEWLGEVPAHWEMLRLKHVLNDMIDTEHKTVHFVEDGDYPVVRTSNIRNGKLLLGKVRYTDYDGFKDWTKRGVPQPGDIIFTREAPAGEACIVPKNVHVCLGQRTVLLKLDTSRINENFCLFSIYSGVASRFIENLSQGSTVSHLNMADIPNMPMLLPPASEQIQVADFVQTKTEEYDRLIKAANVNNSLLKERRSALISAAVTGKIDVRDWQPPADESAFDEKVRQAGLEATA